MESNIRCAICRSRTLSLVLRSTDFLLEVTSFIFVAHPLRCID
jgi:hypothetical protein